MVSEIRQMVPPFIGLRFGLPANKHGIGYLGWVSKDGSIFFTSRKKKVD